MRFKVHFYVSARVPIEIETDETLPAAIVAAAEAAADFDRAVSRGGEAEYAAEVHSCLIDPLTAEGKLIEGHPLAVVGEMVLGNYSFSSEGSLAARFTKVTAFLAELKQVGPFDPVGRSRADIAERLAAMDLLMAHAASLHREVTA
jgi:hypothetical protein